jgi:hypothetical protein
MQGASAAFLYCLFPNYVERHFQVALATRTNICNLNFYSSKKSLHYIYAGFFLMYRVKYQLLQTLISEAESKEKHGVWDPMPELTITSPYVHSRVDSNTFTMGNPARVDINPMPESLYLSQSETLGSAVDFWLNGLSRPRINLRSA